MLRAIRGIEKKSIRLGTTNGEVQFYQANKRPVLNHTYRLYSSSAPNPKKFVLKTFIGVTVVGGVTLGYAKYDPSFRKTLKEYAPFTDSLIATLFQEVDTVGEISKYFSSLQNSIFGSEAPPLPPPKLKDYAAKTIPAEPTKTSLHFESSKQDLNESYIAPEKTETPKPVTKSTGDTETIKLKENQLNVLLQQALGAYNKAIFNLRTYHRDIEHIIDDAVDNVKPEKWADVRQKTKNKNQCISEARDKDQEVTKLINELKSLASTSSDGVRVKNTITRVQEELSKAKQQLTQEINSGIVTEKYWNKVEQARKHFSEQLESLFPTIDLSKKQLKISEDELDLFVLHTYANILYYQKELAKMETVLKEKIQNAINSAKDGSAEALTAAQLTEILEQEKRRLTLIYHQQCLKLKREAEIELREQLKHQSQAFSDHLNDEIKTREMEIDRNLSKKYEEELEAEKVRYKMQLAALVGRLRGLDHALKAKAEADACSKQSQVLWSACQSLLSAVKSGQPGVHWKKQIKPLQPEINAITKAAAENDELVSVVVKSVPKEALERGVYPENALRERFLKVEEEARKVALIPAEGAPLPVHILSYIQSLLLVRAAAPIPQAELNDEVVDFSKLDTNDILQRARYWLDRGDFAQTLKYMNLLQGAPRSIAKQWMNETRILLETQQAANTLMAHAASSGLMYL